MGHDGIHDWRRPAESWHRIQEPINKHRIGALIAAAALTLTFAGTAFAATANWAGNGYPIKENCDDAGTTV